VASDQRSDYFEKNDGWLLLAPAAAAATAADVDMQCSSSSREVGIWNRM